MTGPGWPNARELMAFSVVGLFAFGFASNPHDQTIVGALIAAFAGAWGFYLGGSKVGADTATKNADTLAARASEAPSGTPADPVSVTETKP
jgi:hypothetical protein